MVDSSILLLIQSFCCFVHLPRVAHSYRTDKFDNLPHKERPRTHPRETPQPNPFFRQQHNMEIKNPRRILSVGAPDAGVLKLLQGTQVPLSCRFRLVHADNPHQRSQIRHPSPSPVPPPA